MSTVKVTREQLDDLCKKEYNLLFLGHIASGKTTFLHNLLHYLGYQQFGPTKNSEGLSRKEFTSRITPESSSREISVHKRSEVIRSQRREMDFRGRRSASYKTDVQPVYFYSEKNGFSKVNLIVQGGHCNTEKLSQREGIHNQLDGVFYFVNEVVLGLRDFELEDNLGENRNDLNRSLEEDRASAFRLSQCVPTLQLFVGAHEGFDRIYESVCDPCIGLPRVSNGICNGSLEIETELIHSRFGKLYQRAAFNIFSDFVRAPRDSGEGLGIDDDIVSITKGKEGTLHYRELFSPPKKRRKRVAT